MNIVYSTDPTVITSKLTRPTFSWDKTYKVKPQKRVAFVKRNAPAPTPVAVPVKQLVKVLPANPAQPFLKKSVAKKASTKLNAYQLRAKELDAEAKKFADNHHHEYSASAMVVYGD